VRPLPLPRLALALGLFALLGVAGSPARGETSELVSTRLIYAKAKRIRIHPQVAPGRPGVVSIVPGHGRARGHGPLVRYAVAVEGGLPIDAPAFARAVEHVLADPRSWGAGGAARFQRTDAASARFTVVLTSPSTTDRLCGSAQTNGRYSCASGDRAILNFRRWRTGAGSYGRDLAGYRVYMVNHEVGHVLGHGHARCDRAGARAPVMMQQTKGVRPCRPNPWPLPGERW
jgi:Protein of unknown function (DUF3152)